jgi:hypothetical protein
MGEGDSGGKEPGGVKERDRTEWNRTQRAVAQPGARRYGDRVVEGFPEAGGFGVHRA